MVLKSKKVVAQHYLIAGNRIAILRSFIIIFDPTKNSVVHQIPCRLKCKPASCHIFNDTANYGMSVTSLIEQIAMYEGTD